jgi:hypothetical protein
MLPHFPETSFSECSQSGLCLPHSILGDRLLSLGRWHWLPWKHAAGPKLGRNSKKQAWLAKSLRWHSPNRRVSVVPGTAIAIAYKVSSLDQPFTAHIHQGTPPWPAILRTLHSCNCEHALPRTGCSWQCLGYVCLCVPQREWGAGLSFIPRLLIAFVLWLPFRTFSIWGSG